MKFYTEDEALDKVNGKEVRLGDMFVIRPKLRVLQVIFAGQSKHIFECKSIGSSAC